MIRAIHPATPQLPEDARVAPWLEQARAGSRAAMGQLLQAYQDRLRHLAENAISVNLQAKLDPADLVQDTLLDAVRHFAQFKGESPQQFAAWLRRILLNNAADVARRYQQTDKRCSSLEISLDAVDCGFPVKVRELPLERAEMSEWQAILDRTLAGLPASQRIAILLREQEYLSFASIGQRTGRSAEAARKLWTRAIARLRTEVEKVH